jgi:ADP-ribose pyrophosphatase
MDPAEQVLLSTRKFRVVRRVCRLSNGSTAEHDSVQHPGAVTVLPLADDGGVCLIRNERPAVGETLWELPAGTLDPGESPADCARRELVEETGYRAAQIKKLCEFFMSPGILNERMHLFLATGLTLGEMAPEPGEVIQPIVVPWDRAMSMIDAGDIRDAKSLVGLLYYDRLRRAAPP